jgi:hypothetical protein
MVSYRRDELPGPLDITTARFSLNPQIPRKSSPSAPSGVEHCRQTEPLSALRRIVPPLPLAQITPPAILCMPRRDAFVPVVVTGFHCPWSSEAVPRGIIISSDKDKRRGMVKIRTLLNYKPLLWREHLLRHQILMAMKKVALITGANKGLGLEIARQLAQEGMTVVIAARDEEKAKTAAEKLKGEGLDAHPVKLDVTNAQDIANLPKFFEEHFGQLDVLVNNAGVIYDFESDITADTLRRTYETNVIGPFAITKALLPLLKASLAGRIVNQSSMLGSLALMCKGSMRCPLELSQRSGEFLMD